jgi:hypothetical protein
VTGLEVWCVQDWGWVWCVQDWRCGVYRTGGVVCTGLEVWCVQDWRCGVYRTGGVVCTGLDVQDWRCGVYRTGDVVCTGLEAIPKQLFRVWCVQDWRCGVYRTGVLQVMAKRKLMEVYLSKTSTTQLEVTTQP